MQQKIILYFGRFVPQTGSIIDNSNVQKTKQSPNACNGGCILIVQNRNFMKINDVNECLNSLVNKRCEGYDCIPLS